MVSNILFKSSTTKGDLIRKNQQIVAILKFLQTLKSSKDESQPY